MKLYIANVTKQTHIFAYWRKGVTKIQEPEIKGGTQIVIEGESEQLEGIVRAHRKYGLVEAGDILKDKNFSGIAFHFDSPMNITAMMEAVEKRGTVEDERSQASREVTTASIGNQINAAAREVGLPEVSTVIDIEERQSQESESRGPALRQKLKFDPSAAPDPNTQTSKRARK